jgi:stage II sporulation protein D
MKLLLLSSFAATVAAGSGTSAAPVAADDEESRPRLVALAVPAASPSSPGDASGESVRIAVGRFRRQVLITGADITVRGAGGALATHVGRVTLEVGPRGMRLGGQAVLGDVVRLAAPGLLSLAGHQYRGALEVRFRRYDGVPELLVVHPLDLETYVAGIVSSELPAGWPLEAYKAQAVAARTFALWQKYRRLDLPYHMESSVLDQVYAGAQREHPLAHQATTETRGVVLTAKRQLAQAYFHAACGGRTESAKEGWGNTLPYLPGAVCGACDAAARHRWTARFTQREVDAAFARVLGEPVLGLRVASRTGSGRVKDVEVRGARRTLRLSGADVRTRLGNTRIWSTAIDALVLEGGVLRVEGRGAGHGIGLCQWGARGLALRGERYDAILRRYYPGAVLRPVY